MNGSYECSWRDRRAPAWCATLCCALSQKDWLILVLPSYNNMLSKIVIFISTMTTTREAKRQRETQPDVNEIMIIARRLWQRNPFLQYTAQQEDRSFRETYGCNPMVVNEAWRLLAANDLVPANASIEHLLWTLSFMKSYNTRRNISTLCGGADAGTINTYAFAFIEALADLESLLVCCFCLATLNILVPLSLY